MRGILEGSSFLSGFLLAVDRKARSEDRVKDSCQHRLRTVSRVMIRQGRMLLLRCHEVQIAYPKTIGQLVAGDKNRERRDHLSLRGARMYARPPLLSKYSTCTHTHRQAFGTY